MIDELESNRETIAELCRHFEVTSLSVFGSAVDGTFDQRSSDLDLLVHFDPASSQCRFDAFFGLKEAFEELFGRPVDLISVESIGNPYFASAVDEPRHELYAIVSRVLV